MLPNDETEKFKVDSNMRWSVIERNNCITVFTVHVHWTDKDVTQYFSLAYLANLRVMFEYHISHMQLC